MIFKNQQQFIKELESLGELKRISVEVDPKLETEQVRKLTKLKANRDNNKVKQLLDSLKAAANSSDNIVYPVLEAVENYATVGEISDCLRKVWGEYHEKNL